VGGVNGEPVHPTEAVGLIRIFGIHNGMVLGLCALDGRIKLFEEVGVVAFLDREDRTAVVFFEETDVRPVGADCILADNDLERC